MLDIDKLDVWTATCEDRPGGMMQKLEGLIRAGANPEFVLTGRALNGQQTGQLLVTPLFDPRAITAAQDLGFTQAADLHCVRVQGADEPGLQFLIMRALAREGINLRGATVTRLASQFVLYLAFDSSQTAQRAVDLLERPL
jgi:hypothetical protein